VLVRVGLEGLSP